MNAKGPRDDQRVLELLDAVGRQNDLSQRYLARHMGVALGLANSYLKRCIRKGLIKISAAPANRYLYYLTPKGFAEKSRLTAQYLSSSFEFYRQAGDSCVRVLRECEKRAWRRIIVCGASDLTEIVLLRALESNIEVIGVFDPYTPRQKVVGRPVWKALGEAGRFDGCVLTDVSTPRESYERVVQKLGRERVLVPDILRLE